ncbi:MAG: peptidase M41, partial [Mucinivorans sp.]
RGGRVGLELVFGQVSSGALNDLERNTKQSYAMIAFYGMSPVIGNLSYYDSSGQDMMFNKPYSEQTALHIDQEVKKLIDECYEVARAILIEHKDGHIRLAEMLLEREVIFTEDLVEIFGQRPVAEK